MSRNKEAINLSWLVEKWTIWDNSYLKNIWLNLDTLDLIRINDDMDNNDDIEESYIDIAKASYTKKEERHEKNTKDRLKTYSDEDVLVTSSQEFGNFINDFPELSNNQNVKILLDEIINSENYLSNSKIELNRCIESYNSLIHQFPLALLRKPLKFTDKEFYREEVQITDEMLGI